MAIIKWTFHRSFRFALCALLSLILAINVIAPASAETLTVMTSGAFRAALDKLSAAYQKKTGNTITIVQGPSMGADPTAIPARLARGEKADIVILARSGLDQLTKDRYVMPTAETDLVVSKIAMAVKDGAAVPNIATVDNFKRALLTANSIAYSDSASGVYIKTKLWKKLGLERQLAPKSKMIQATPVGEIVAKGEAQVGFQQMSELLPVKGIYIVGLIPEAVQEVTIFSEGILTEAPHPAVAKSFATFLTSPEAFSVIRSSGMEPARTGAK